MRKTVVSYKECEKWAQEQQFIKNSADWQRAYKEFKLPHSFPSHPDQAFKNEGWQNWHVFSWK